MFSGGGIDFRYQILGGVAGFGGVRVGRFSRVGYYSGGAPLTPPISRVLLPAGSRVGTYLTGNTEYLNICLVAL
jgi:hypothetical protein